MPAEIPYSVADRAAGKYGLLLLGRTCRLLPESTAMRIFSDSNPGWQDREEPYIEPYPGWAMLGVYAGVAVVSTALVLGLHDIIRMIFNAF